MARTLLPVIANKGIGETRWVPADGGRWAATGADHRKTGDGLFRGNKVITLAVYGRFAGCWFLPALVEAGFQGNPTARIFVFSESQ
jgi:hypothetical protein